MPQTTKLLSLQNNFGNDIMVTWQQYYLSLANLYVPLVLKMKIANMLFPKLAVQPKIAT